jgi:hypothetical protein
MQILVLRPILLDPDFFSHEIENEVFDHSQFIELDHSPWILGFCRNLFKLVTLTADQNSQVPTWSRYTGNNASSLWWMNLVIQSSRLSRTTSMGHSDHVGDYIVVLSRWKKACRAWSIHSLCFSENTPNTLRGRVSWFSSISPNIHCKQSLPCILTQRAMLDSRWRGNPSTSLDLEAETCWDFEESNSSCWCIRLVSPLTEHYMRS